MSSVIHSSSHYISPSRRTPVGSNWRGKCDQAKGKNLLNRGSIPPPYLPSSFLPFSKTPDIGIQLKYPPSANCLDTIEPRFEPSAEVASSHHRLHLHRTAFGAVQVCRRRESPTTTPRGRLQGLTEVSTSTHSSFILRSLNTEHRKLITAVRFPFPIHHSLFTIHYFLLPSPMQ